MNKKSFSILALASALFALLAGCNTMEGAGQDIERAGEEIQEEAR